MSLSSRSQPRPADAAQLQSLHAYWQAANYLSAAQIYLLDNPLLAEPLTLQHVKPRLVGHWGTTPGLNFIYAHLNRIINAHDLSVLFVAGPGHGAAGLVANAYLEGVYSTLYPSVPQSVDGLRSLFRQFSFPGGISSHAGPATPGSIHEGGELGYSLAHAFGAAFDNPGLLVACVVGDGEAETGPLAASWHSNKFLNPARDGAVLPILHLNGYKIAGPSMLSRLPHAELAALLTGYGYEPLFVEGDDPIAMHRLMADTLDIAVARIMAIAHSARTQGYFGRPRWPMVILRTPKGWTGPAIVDGRRVEGTFRAHQIPIAELDKPEHLHQLETWLRSYQPWRLFDAEGRLIPALAALAPRGERRMSANPATGASHRATALALPDFRSYACPVAAPGALQAEAPRLQGNYVRDVLRMNPTNFRVFSPDETTSNRWDALFKVSARCSTAQIEADDDHVAPDGRIMEVLSEHLCQGWLEGYLLTGRHGIFSCYEAFIHIADSMFNQHAKWLAAARAVAWRHPIPSLNYMLTSHVWRQDHNGASHQDPGFIDHVLNKKAEIVRVYLPPDANTLLCVTDHCLRSEHYVNVIVAGKQPAPQWLDMPAAVAHCRAGIGIWEWASTDRDDNVDVVLACAGDVPTLEILAAASLLATDFPDLHVRVVNVVDLMKLQPATVHPHGLPEHDYDTIFGAGIPVIFAYHGYPALIHRLTYRRGNHDRLHVRGFNEEGSTTTPFDMVVLNRMDRFSLYLAALEQAPRMAPRFNAARRFVAGKLATHRAYIEANGCDLPEITDWRWQPLSASNGSQ